MNDDAGIERYPEEIEPRDGDHAGPAASDDLNPYANEIALEHAGAPLLQEEIQALPETPYWLPKYVEPEITRTPNFLDAVIFLLIMTASLVVTTLLTALAVYLHWFGIKGFQEASKNTGVTLAVQMMLYLLSLAVALPVFRRLWDKPFFAGLHWHGATALRRWYWLLPAVFGCNVLAALGDKILPFPEHAPIDQLFGTTRDAWMLAIFGVTIAPFFEEMIFRGFLLPATATAWDWIGERITGAKPRPLDAHGNPVWSVGAMVVGSLIVSAPFALMHSPQLGHAWGPLVLLYCVSLVLCAMRLVTRSLAVSTLVHSMYNFMLFAVMFAQTDGFRHMDKM
jgi:uncharacterized protein